MHLLLLLVSCMTIVAAEEARGLRPLTVVDERGGSVTFASSRALLIGNSAYTAGWDALPGVREDIAAVQAALEAQGFAVQVARDLTKVQMGEVIDTFVGAQAQDPAGRVIVYYAGHGQTLGQVGYLVPVDAPKPSDASFRAKAYPIMNLKIKAQEAQARHVLFACDSCFSGSVFTPMRGANEYVLSAAREPVRMFLTAGSADETVPDVSFFRQEFVRGIGGAADANRDGYVTGSELATHIKQTVRDRAGAMGKRLTPQAGVSEQEGLNRGDFVFRVPASGAPPMSAPVQPPQKVPGAGSVDLSDVQRRAAAEREAQAKWNEWQKRMDAACAEVETMAMDTSISESIRREAIDRVLAAFSEDNPNTSRDDDARKKLISQKASLPGAAKDDGPTPVAAVPAAPAVQGSLPVVRQQVVLASREEAAQVTKDYAIVELFPTARSTPIANANISGDWTAGPLPERFQGMYLLETAFTRAEDLIDKYLEFRVLKDGMVNIRARSEWGGGGNGGGNWKPDMTNLNDLFSIGWKDTGERVYGGIVLRRWCKAGEAFHIRCGKYGGPALIHPMDGPKLALKNRESWPTGWTPVVVDSRVCPGADLGNIPAGTTLEVRYRLGSWTEDGTRSWSSPDDSNRPEAHAAVIASWAQGTLNVHATIPAGTAEKPFSFVVPPHQGPLVICIADKAGYGDNGGFAVYEVRLPAAAAGPPTATPPAGPRPPNPRDPAQNQPAKPLTQAEVAEKMIFPGFIVRGYNDNGYQKPIHLGSINDAQTVNQQAIMAKFREAMKGKYRTLDLFLKIRAQYDLRTATTIRISGANQKIIVNGKEMVKTNDAFDEQVPLPAGHSILEVTLCDYGRGVGNLTFKHPAGVKPYYSLRDIQDELALAASEADAPPVSMLGLPDTATRALKKLANP
jgi:hypothetical protein